MGLGQSIPRDLSHQQLYELTKDSRTIMNILLEYMLKEISVRDFLSLSNPAECKKYVLFMANNLHKYFYELQILPIKDKRGVLAFRPVKELASPPDPATEKQKQSLCLVLAYYYTRIFQIYGALALTLIDDVNLMTQSGIISSFSEDRSRLFAPGQQPFTTLGGQLEGGAENWQQSLRSFYFLRSTLTSQGSTSSRGYPVLYEGDDDSEAVIYFKRESRLDRDQSEHGVFTIGVKGSKQYAYLDVYSKQQTIVPPSFTFQFGKLRYYPKNSSILRTIDIPSNVLSPKKVTFINEDWKEKSSAYVIEDSDQTILEYITDAFHDIIPYLRTVTKEEEYVVDDKKEKGRMVSNVGTPEELRMSRTIHHLTKTKPLGHCIARALQLLQNVPFKDEPGISHICKAKFFEQTTTSSDGKKYSVDRSGLPKPGSTLDDSPGMSALSQLFYEIVFYATPKLEISTKKGPNGTSPLDDYITFMRNMAILYGDNKTAGNQPRSSESFLESNRPGLKSIKDRRDRDLCPVSGDITISNQTSKKVYEYVNKLFHYQLEHSKKCGAIFQKLFSMKRDKATNRFQIALSNNILQKGFPEIERINAEARKLLVDYYSNCEQTYLIGMKAVLDSKRPTTPAPATQPTTPSPSAPPRP